MAQIIRGHAMIPLSFQVSRTGMGLNIESLSLGSMPNVYSFNLEPATPPRDAANEPERNSAADFINFIQPSIPPDGCPNHSPELYLINESPRVIYVKAFLTEEERLHVLAKSESRYTSSHIYKPGSDVPIPDEMFRKSETAIVERDPVIQCIEYRAQYLQSSWKAWKNMAIEPLTVQRYQKGGFFNYHLDASQDPSLPNRKSTFNVWLDGSCTGGGTHFPSLPRLEDPSLCVYLDCSVSPDNGTVFKPIPRNAIFWESLSDDGQVNYETQHAGLTVEEGSKIGLNIWTWEFEPGDSRGQM